MTTVPAHTTPKQPIPTESSLTLVQDQWQRKKQTKEQARAAKRGKLDPDSALNRNAKEVLDERARNKRKAEKGEEESSQEEADHDDDNDDESEGLEGIEKEEPGQGLKKRKAQDEDEPNKRARLAEPQAQESTSEKLSAHQQKKLLKKQKKAEKKAEKKMTKSKKPVDDDGDGEEGSQDGETDSTVANGVLPSEEAEDEEDEEVSLKKEQIMRPIDVSGLAEEGDNHSSQSSTPESPTFDSTADKPSAEPASTTTSIASEAAGAERPSSASKKLKVPSDTTELRARLAAKIAALRAARKADGPDGAPIRTRQELIESRRKKEAERKAHKKELRQKAKEAEDKKREEALASARNSPMLSFGSPGSPEQQQQQETSFSFGRVAFADGTQMSQDLSYVKDRAGRKKGPSDPKGALAKLEAQKRRLAGLDADKRKEVLEKETWLAARKRAEGDKVRNDESLLKKAVKRKDKSKKKSEREWTERSEGVKYAQKQKQQKREDNIRKRKEAKMAGKAGRKGKGKSPTKKKSRPGFEGGGFGGGKRK